MTTKYIVSRLRHAVTLYKGTSSLQYIYGIAYIKCIYDWNSIKIHNKDRIYSSLVRLVLSLFSIFSILAMENIFKTHDTNPIDNV